MEGAHREDSAPRQRRVWLPNEKQTYDKALDLTKELRRGAAATSARLSSSYSRGPRKPARRRTRALADMLDLEAGRGDVVPPICLALRRARPWRTLTSCSTRAKEQRPAQKWPPPTLATSSCRLWRVFRHLEIISPMYHLRPLPQLLRDVYRVQLNSPLSFIVVLISFLSLCLFLLFFGVSFLNLLYIIYFD